jgi:transposase
MMSHDTDSPAPSDARSLSSEAQEALRERAVRAVLDGMTQVEAARVLGVSRAAVAKWMRAWRAGGMAALAARTKGRPAGKGRLAGWQAAQIVRAITDRTPDQLKLPFMLWTRRAVADLIEARFGLRLSVWTVGRLLARWGMTPQKPARRAWERDPEQVRRWLDVEYPRVRAKARSEGAQIHWGDEMGLRSDHQAGTSWAPRGRTPVVEGTGRRWRCNMISSITGLGQLRFMVFKGRFTTEVFLQFLRRLVKGSARKIVLIVDGHPVHKAAAVRDWVARHAGRIELVLLPAYSPDLNPDEFLNHDVKQNAVGRRRAAGPDEMIADTRAYLRARQRRPDIVRRYFHAPSVRYAAID